jgi:glycosyltransferase involved in cell wall biosynthesis
MKICVLYRNYFGERGGAGVTAYLRNLKVHLEARGHSVYIISSRVKEDEKKLLYHASSFPVYPLTSFTGTLTFLFPSLLKLIKINHEEKFDLVYTIGETGALSPIIKRLLYIPIVNHLVFTRQTQLKIIENKWNPKEYVFLPTIPLSMISARSADKIITLCSFFRDEAIKFFDIKKNDFVVIPNGVDIPENGKITINIREKYHITNNDIVFLFVGGTQKRKGISELINAFNMTDIQNKKLLIVGVITKDFKNKKFGENITLTGRITNERLKDIYSCADIFILPTKWEGQPIVVLEAMSYGLPIITTNKYGMVDQVDDGITGFLLDSLQPERIAEKMERIVAMNYKKMGERSREKAEREFSWSSVAERTIKVFEEVIREHGR